LAIDSQFPSFLVEPDPTDSKYFEFIYLLPIKDDPSVLNVNLRRRAIGASCDAQVFRRFGLGDPPSFWSCVNEHV